MWRLSVLLALLGIAGAAALVLRFDAGDVWRAMLSIGWAGAALLLALQGVLFGLLGLAWSAVQPGLSRRRLVWGRMMRDAGTTCLPFSPVGGYVLGVRALFLRGTDWTVAAAGTVVDVTAEIVAQALFALFGAATLLSLRPGAALAVPVAVGVTAALAGLATAVTQRHQIGRVGGALAARLFGARAEATAALGTMADRLYADRRRVLAGVALHFSGWMFTGVVTWVSLRLLGLTLPLLPVLALEALLDAAVAMAFMVPGAAGVQEAGYVGLGALLGVPPDLALSASLLRRAREVTWGLPILAAWQWQEVRRL